MYIMGHLSYQSYIILLGTLVIATLCVEQNRILDSGNCTMPDLRMISTNDYCIVHNARTEVIFYLLLIVHKCTSYIPSPSSGDLIQTCTHTYMTTWMYTWTVCQNPMTLLMHGLHIDLWTS